ncbi:HigA family addiction module antidote protein [Ruficoccus amylovorans]|uniref:HigA family addiction module antidote protein n=1 Tax=Ruficoccus amylovorans TaxID=1804625 RepID=A0A842HH42_9BACT|nr:HigA family addiction module antitoxin [Ruficoccus amylovorans]MBC2594867.1 HigA family addiction module antidote protein [Ruficoccus amylovorans]
MSVHNDPISPADFLNQRIQENKLTAYKLSRETGLPQSRLSEILSSKRRITTETALALSQYFRESPDVWMSIQAKWDINESQKDGSHRVLAHGTLKLGPFANIPCYVLDDSTRVISAKEFSGILQIGTSYANASKLANLLDHPMLKSQKIKDLIKRVSKPLKFINEKGIVAYGYDGNIIVDYCKALLDVRRQTRGQVSKVLLKAADMAEAMILSLAELGIQALIDEATGYQLVRHRDELQNLFDRFFRKNYAAWAKTFPDEYYQNLFRLKAWKWSALSSKRPPVVGKLTKDIVYERLDEDVLLELERLNPANDKGRRKVKHHQWLTEEIGHPRLAGHLYAVIGLMRGQNNWESFYHLLQLSFPKKNEHVQLELADLGNT